MFSADITHKLKMLEHYQNLKEGVAVHLEAHPALGKVGFELFFKLSLGVEMLLLKADSIVKDEAELPKLIEKWEFVYEQNEEGGPDAFEIWASGSNLIGSVEPEAGAMSPFLVTKPLSAKELATQAKWREDYSPEEQTTLDKLRKEHELRS